MSEDNKKVASGGILKKRNVINVKNDDDDNNINNNNNINRSKGDSVYEKNINEINLVNINNNNDNNNNINTNNNDDDNSNNNNNNTDIVLSNENGVDQVPRTIGLLGGISFIVGTIVGSGIFISPRGVAMYAKSVGMTLVIWLVSGLVTLIGALCYAELGTIITLSGADYIYLDKAYGPLISYQFSWVNNVLVKPGQLATVALTFAEYGMSLFYMDSCGLAPDTINKIVACLLIGGINGFSVKLASQIQIIFTIAKLAALALIIIGGIVMLAKGYTEHLSTGFQNTENQIGLLFTGFYSGMWAYDGWNTANFMTEEIINVERNLPLSIIIGLPFVIVLFIFTNVSYFTVLSVDQMVESNAVALSWAEYVIPNIKWVVPIFVALSCFGTANGTLFSGGRLVYAAARNDHLPGILSMVHIERYTPIPAVVINVICAILLCFLGSISTLIDLLSFIMWMFYGLNFLAVIVFRFKMKHVNRPVKVPLILPIIAFIFAVCLVVIPLAVSPQTGYFYALGFIALGYVVYIPLVHFKLKLPCMDCLTTFLQMVLQVFTPDKIDT